MLLSDCDPWRFGTANIRVGKDVYHKKRLPGGPTPSIYHSVLGYWDTDNKNWSIVILS